jgi:hypothetical protein
MFIEQLGRWLPVRVFRFTVRAVQVQTVEPDNGGSVLTVRDTDELTSQEQVKMGYVRRMLVGGLGAVMLAIAPVQAQEAGWKLAGTVEINTTQMAFIISGKVGGGILHFEGGEYFFNVGGIGVGGIGVQTVNAIGAVYNMDDVSKFAGRYVEAGMGATVGKGKGRMRLSNQHGVILDLKASSSGVALSLGAEGVIISMK